MTSFSDGAPLYPAGTTKPAFVPRGMESAATMRVRDARGGLLLTHPFFGVLSLKLEIQENDKIPTARVNSKSLQFNPGFIETLSNSELKGLIAHEVMHLAMLHHTRQGSKEHDLWNQACDYAINPELEKDGFTLPKGGLNNPRFNGMSAESIYRILEAERPKEDGGKNGQGPGQGEPNPCGDFESPGPTDSAENGEAEREWTQNAQEAIRAASGAGKLPGGLRLAVTKGLASKAPWEALLRRFANDQCRTENTWSKRNRRFPGIHLPGKRNKGIGPLVIGVDTSGSISQSVLARFSAEIARIADDVEPSEVHVIYCDTGVHRVDVFQAGEPVTMKAQGGGGTMFTPVFERVTETGINPVALIYLTDLDCSDFPSDPGYPVLWASYGPKDQIAPMGETIHVE